MSSRIAPYLHVDDDSPCWTRNCSKPNNALPQHVDEVMRVTMPPTAQELAAFGAWLADPDDPAKSDAAKTSMLASISHVEPALPGQTFASVDTEKLHAMFEDAYRERLHILAHEEQDAYLYHMIDADTLMVEVLGRYDEAADDGDIDAMRDKLFLEHMDPTFKAATQTWLTARVGRDYPYDAARFGVDLNRQSFEEAYQAGVTTALTGWLRRERGNPYDAAANGVFPQDGDAADHGHQSFYDRGVLAGLLFRARRR